MKNPQSDTLVFFGATGDLAFKMIFPALHAMVKRGFLDVPVVGIGRSDWTVDQLRNRARESLAKKGVVDSDACEKLCNLLRYARVDYAKPETFKFLRKELGGAKHPAHYLAIPPGMFETVIDHLEKSGCANGARVLVEKPFGRDLNSARELNRILLRTFDESDIFRIDHFLGKRPVENLRFFRSANTFLEPIWNHHYIDSVQITLAEDFGVQDRGGFYEETGAIRDVIQNHLFQVLTNLAMEPVTGNDSQSIHDKKVSILKAIPTLKPKDIVRGQFIGYRDVKGVGADSRVETFAAIRMEIENERWQGVPFYLRAGKCLPITCTEVMVRLRQPTILQHDLHIKPNTLRLRISPEILFALGMNVLGADEKKPGQAVEMVACRRQLDNEPSAYERVLTDAMRGDNILFARQDYAEEAWRIVDTVMQADTPIHEYQPNSWGPSYVDQSVLPPGGWHNPVASDNTPEDSQ